MNVAVWPAEPSPGLLKAMALAGFDPTLITDLPDADRDAVSDWEALVVELDDEAPHQLRTVLRISQEFESRC